MIERGRRRRLACRLLLRFGPFAPDDSRAVGKWWAVNGRATGVPTVADIHVRLCLRSAVGNPLAAREDVPMAEREHGELGWSEVAGRLARARSYWLGTTNPDGSPHATPVWGVVGGGGFYIYSERSTIKARNLARDGRAVVHLESSEEVVIVHGEFDDIGRPADTPEVVEALDDKYDQPDELKYLPSADGSFDVLYRLRPKKALTWCLADYEHTQRRWSAPPAS